MGSGAGAAVAAGGAGKRGTGLVGHVESAHGQKSVLPVSVHGQQPVSSVSSKTTKTTKTNIELPEDWEAQLDNGFPDGSTDESTTEEEDTITEEEGSESESDEQPRTVTYAEPLVQMVAAVPAVMGTASTSLEDTLARFEERILARVSEMMARRDPPVGNGVARPLRK